jgi:hypothetical protein
MPSPLLGEEHCEREGGGHIFAIPPSPSQQHNWNKWYKGHFTLKVRILLQKQRPTRFFVSYKDTHSSWTLENEGCLFSQFSLRCKKTVRRIHNFIAGPYLLWNTFLRFIMFSCHIKPTWSSKMLMESKSAFLSYTNRKQDSIILLITLLLSLLLLLLVKEIRRQFAAKCYRRFFSCVRKVKQSTPWRPIGMWDVKDPTLSRQSAHS